MSDIRPRSVEGRKNAQTPRPSAPTPPAHLNALFGPGNSGFIVFTSKVYSLIEDAPTIEHVIDKLLQEVPLSKIDTAFVHYPPSIEDRVHFIDALRQAGFKNIQGISPLSLTLSAAFIHVHPQHIDERVMIVLGLEDGLPLDDCKVCVIEKCDGGWKVIVENLTVSEALAQFPTVMDVILWDRQSLKDQLLPVLTAFLGKSKHYSLMKCPSIEGTYVQQYGKHINDSLPAFAAAFLNIPSFLLGSKIVLPYCDVVLSVGFGTENVAIPLTGQIAPFTVTKEIDIGSSTIVKVRGALPNDKAGPRLFKTFTFGKSTPRMVLVTVDVDKTLLPEVKLTTIGSNQGEDDVKVTVKTPKAKPAKALSTPNLSIEFGGKVEVMDFTGQVLPFGQQKEFDVGDAMEVVVFACSDDGEIESKSHIKTLQFKKRRSERSLLPCLLTKRESLKLLSELRPRTNPMNRLQLSIWTQIPTLSSSSFPTNLASMSRLCRWTSTSSCWNRSLQGVSCSRTCLTLSNRPRSIQSTLLMFLRTMKSKKMARPSLCRRNCPRPKPS